MCELALMMTESSWISGFIILLTKFGIFGKIAVLLISDKTWNRKQGIFERGAWQ
jgi:hypothetical protein